MKRDGEINSSPPSLPPSFPNRLRLPPSPHAWFAAFSWEKVTAWPIKESYEQLLDVAVESTLTTSWTLSMPRKYHHSGGGSWKLQRKLLKLPGPTSTVGQQ